ncbi:putative metal-dependent hydrolase [Caldalkalibacillus uzonensis]|uniref:Metal-dependent hydrolase n=1 Tax=Caldalkalibacillus uzonensis TaxID=353224 RepID=A0ABU0CLT2_9BACI|nr:DUF309 domain-containing protein [Caldalkalibacillus uzonensis]MDQ0337370.1 putative metal-dependent hydrolase [Caldalkalibacillus uzonensis]
MAYHHLYLLYLYYFNIKRDYYECHDVLEELWLEEGCYSFYQGLIQVAVGLYHFRWDNVEGAKLLFEGGLSKLESYPDYHYGINVKKLRHEVKRYLQKLNNIKEDPFEFYDLTIEIVDDELKEMVEGIQREMEQ